MPASFWFCGRFPCFQPRHFSQRFSQNSQKTPVFHICFILRSKRRQKSDKKALFYQFLSRPAPADWRQGRELLPPSSQPQVCKVCRRGRAFCLRPAAPGRKAGIWSDRPPLTNPSFETHAYKKKPQRCPDSLQQGRFPRPVFPGRAFHSPDFPILPLPAHLPARAPLPGSPGPSIPRLICRQQAGTGLLRYDASRNTPLTSMNP